MSDTHVYDYKVRLDDNTAGSLISGFTGKSKKVLEVGAGPGAVTQVLINVNECDVTAIEIDPDAIEMLKTHCNKIFSCDLNDRNWYQSVIDDGPYETIIAGDVLEHLNDPWYVLESMQKLLSKDGEVIISLPHVGHAAVIGSLLRGDFAYNDWGLLDRTHIRFFCLNNIQDLFNQAGYKIIDVNFVLKSPEVTEFANSWNTLSSEMRKLLSSAKYAEVYQVVVKAKASNSPEPGLDITQLDSIAYRVESLTNQSFKVKTINRLKSLILPHLSFKNRTRISNILLKLGIRL